MIDKETEQTINEFCKIIQDKVSFVRDWCLWEHWETAYGEIDNLQTTIRSLEGLVDKWRKESKE